MRLTRYFAIAIIFVFCATSYLPAKAAGPDIPADKPLTVVKVEVVAGDEGSSVYYSDLNRWVIGPNGWVEWKITVEEKVSRAVGLIDLNPDAAEHHQQAFAHFDRLEGNNTLVFRFTPNPHLQTYNLTPGRFITIWYGGVYILEKDKDGKEVEKYTQEIDFRRISTMPQVFLKSGFPTYTISPSPEEVMIDGNFHGLMADQVMLDINDEILKPESFEFRYSWSGTQMSDWFQMKDRNPIDVPSEHRGKPVSLQLNVRDAIGNEIFKSHVYGGRQVNNTTEVTAEFYTVLAGREHFEPYTLLSMIDPNNRGTWDVLSDWGTLREDLENLIAQGMSAKDAVEYLKEEYRIRGYQKLRDLEGKYSEPQEYFSEEISIMLRPSAYYNPQYYSDRNSRNRIDLAASGFQWSQNLYMDHIDYSIPLYPFKEEDIYPVWEKGGDPSGTYEGWRVVIPGQTEDEDYGVKDDGVYYLYILIADKRTSCSNNHIVFYNAHDIREKRVRGMSFVKLIKDTTPPVITFSEQDFDSKDFDITIKVEDLGIRAAQYRINTPDQEGEFIDMPISEDGLTAEVTFNTMEIFQPSGRQDFTVEVRVLEKRHTPSETEWEGFWNYQYG